MEKYTLQEYVSYLSQEGLVKEMPESLEGAKRPVELVSCDSRDVVDGTLFICKGAHFKPEFLQKAAEAGAFCYLSEQPYPGAGIPGICVTDIRRAMALLANRYYNDPWKKLNVTGITGTKGKSSTTYYVKSILDEYMKSAGGPESGVISSIDTYDGVERFESHLTTPEPLELEHHFRNGVDTGMKYLTMEISSQALKYDRVLGVRFAVACFLNIGYDHISPIEHPDWEDYFASKLRIFEQCETAVVNLDSDHSDRVMASARRAAKVITFSQQDPSADVYGYDVRKDQDETVFRVRTAKMEREFRLSMPGLFNVQNALAAIAICESYGVPERCIYTGLLKARVPGRMEIYANADKHVIAIVDYAHNRLSFEKLFTSVKEEYPGRRIVIVFGCPGKKALDRRRDLGEIAGKYAQHVYLTEEDPGEEDALAICREIAQHVSAQGCPYTILTDRGDAIRAAVEESAEKTVILITGKGAETREKRGIEYIPVPSDVDYTKEALHAFDLAHHLDGMTQVQGLLKTLPRLFAYEKEIIVIKYGGSALGDGDTVDTILEDVAALRMAGARVVLVHGGGANITRWLNKMGVEAHFENGYRVTDDVAMEVTEMALSGQVNKQIVSALRKLSVTAAGVSGRDGDLFLATAKTAEDGTSLGHVGTICRVNPGLVLSLLDAGYVPVVSPVSMDADGNAANVNADEAAAALAKALAARKLVYLTDVDGILMDQNNEKTLVEKLTASHAEELLNTGMMSGGMVPKLRNCIDAIRSGVKQVVILDGRVEHTILLEAVSDQTMGTVIVPDL